MRRARRTLDAWPALADMLFVLFLASLAVAAKLEDLDRRAEEVPDVSALEAEIARLSEQIERVRTCADGQAFRLELLRCLRDSPRLSADLDDSDQCALSLGGSAIQFQTNSEKPISQEPVDALAGCLHGALSALERDEPATLDLIEAVYIDGHSDAEGSSLYNLDLSGRRAHTLYRAYRAQVVGRGVPEGEDRDARFTASQRRLLALVFPRSFGEYRPNATGGEAERRIRDGEASADDRRVTITLVMRLQRAPEAAPSASSVTARPGEAPAPAPPGGGQN